MDMKAAAADLHRVPARLDTLDWPGTGGKPQVLDHIAQFLVALGGQLGYLYTLLHIRVVRVQRLEQQRLLAQRADQLDETRALAQQVAVALVELLALGIVQAQVERVAVSVRLAACGHFVAQGLERPHLGKTRQAAHQRQDARMECTHQLSPLGRRQFELPQGEHLQQALDEVTARLAGEGHHGQGIELEAQVVAQQQDAQHQRSRLAGAGAGHHAGRGRVAENQLPLRRARLSLARQPLGDISLEAPFQLGGHRQAPVVEQVVITSRRRSLVRAGIADHQDLAPGLIAIDPALLVALTQAIGMAVALPRGVAEEPGVAMLRLQARQTAAQQARDQATQPGQLGGRGQVGRGPGMLVRHGHSVENQNSRHVRLIRAKVPANAYGSVD